METIIDLPRVREADSGDLHHAVIQITRDILYGFPLCQGDPADCCNDRLSFRSLHNRHETPCFSMPLFVRQDGVEFAARHIDFIDAQVIADVLREHQPPVGIILVLPVMEITEVIAVHPHEVFRMQQIGLGDGGECNGLCVSRVLLKNCRIPFQVACQEHTDRCLV